MRHPVDSAGLIVGVLREVGIPLPTSRERDTMKYRVADLEGALLDAAVLLAEGEPFGLLREHDAEGGRLFAMSGGVPWAPSQAWDHGGPIIERERIDILANHVWKGGGLWYAALRRDGPRSLGPTPLIAAMRAYVASKFGDEVELP